MFSCPLLLYIKPQLLPPFIAIELVIKPTLVMEITGHLLLVLLLLTNALTISSLDVPRNYGMHLIDRKSEPSSPISGINALNRSSFPQGFVFGAASSSYQIEGGIEDRGRNIWDTFTHKYPEKIVDHSNGDVAIDSYHRYKEDVGLIKGIGFDVYRFSISWSRVLPGGKLSAGVSEKGIQYYKNLINELKAKHIKPYVTLFHWDLPQPLEDEYGGFLSPKIVDDFRDYAELCFKTFGDDVKNWATFNEPWSFSNFGYAAGYLAPGRCSSWLNNNCTGGDSGTEPYLVTHYQLLAHAAAVQLYKQKYQSSQKGIIGIVLVSSWIVPFSTSAADYRASRRALDFQLGWFMGPIVFGEYPATMRALVRKRLPKFSKIESDLLKGSFDFVGINYYTASYAQHAMLSQTQHPSYTTDSRVTLTTQRNGTILGAPAGVYPIGIWRLLLYVKHHYNNPLIIITENGIGETNNSTLTPEEAIRDNFRINYYYRHIQYVQRAIRDGVNLAGYIAWSILDNFEWSQGYTVRFGINYVDYNNGLKRIPKLSAKWFQKFLQK
ncbi:hypothetical protein F0562_035625 [Nyssa sinensis]|uniref:Beta-glucosidase n=1 Tax=Nyssa sinensis TaxID=561372 RepID=A0A5J5AE27_9ASTE|nr:hypothetical protein F0562_035009 [Nyssa sinensis]KAA8528124.1 hypothetical protein F0562_035625 [Nyssa sinensis]